MRIAGPSRRRGGNLKLRWRSSARSARPTSSPRPLLVVERQTTRPRRDLHVDSHLWTHAQAPERLHIKGPDDGRVRVWCTSRPLLCRHKGAVRPQDGGLGIVQGGASVGVGDPKVVRDIRKELQPEGVRCEGGRRSPVPFHLVDEDRVLEVWRERAEPAHRSGRPPVG